MDDLVKVLRAAAPDASAALVEWIFSEIANAPEWKSTWKRGSERKIMSSLDAAEHEVLEAVRRKLRPSA